jgi:hypothetical protein
MNTDKPTQNFTTTYVEGFDESIKDEFYSPDALAKFKATLAHIELTSHTLSPELAGLIEERQELFGELFTEVLDSCLIDVSVGRLPDVETADDLARAVLMRCQKVHCDALTHDQVWTDKSFTALAQELELELEPAEIPQCDICGRRHHPVVENVKEGDPHCVCNSLRRLEGGRSSAPENSKPR